MSFHTALFWSELYFSFHFILLEYLFYLYFVKVVELTVIHNSHKTNHKTNKKLFVLCYKKERHFN